VLQLRTRQQNTILRCRTKLAGAWCVPELATFMQGALTPLRTSTKIATTWTKTEDWHSTR
jgi:hypothetical protein